MSFNVQSKLNNLRFGIFHSAPPSTQNSAAGMLNVGASVGLSHVAARKFEVSLWVPGTSTTVQASGASIGCSATASAVVRD